MQRTKSMVPFRQIRALYDEDCVTVYQAYSSSIAVPAVEHQRLNASPDFSGTRMTWMKPSWCWMMWVPPWFTYTYPTPDIVGTDRDTHIRISVKSGYLQ